MPEPLTFRTRHGTYVFLLVLAAGALVAQYVAVVLPARGTYLNLHSGLTYALAAFPALVIAAWAAGWRRIAVSEEGIERRSLLGKRRVRWEEVTAVRFSALGLFGPPAIVLGIGHRKWWQLHPVAEKPFRVSGACRDCARLVEEVLRRLPQAAVSEAVRRHVATPRRVGWAFRLTAALAQAGSLTLVAWALVCFDRWDPFFPVVAPAAVGVAFLAWFFAGPLGREWRWKPRLAAPFPLLLIVTAGVTSLDGLWFAAWEVFFAMLALCVGWGTGNLFLTLPWRRWWLGAGVYGGCLAAVLGTAAWLFSNEGIPFRKTTTLAGWPGGVVWSLDGRALCVLGRGALPHGTVCHVVDAQSLAARSFPLGLPVYSSLPAPRAQHVTMRSLPVPSSLRFPDGRHVVIPAWAPEAGQEHGELWVLDTATGGLESVFASEGRIFIADEGFASPDRKRVVFMAGPAERKGVYVLSLAGCAVRQFPTGLGLRETRSESRCARYRADGALLLEEHETPPWSGKEALTTCRLWAFRPGDSELALLYQATGDSIQVRASPDVRWAIVASRPRKAERGLWEIVDLLTGQSRRLETPRGQGCPGMAWTPDGKTLAYGHREGDQDSVVVVDTATGEMTARWHLPSGWPEYLSRSPDGRYACYLGRTLLARQRVLDLRTGRCVRLWRSPGFEVFHTDYLAWSPEGSCFAMSRIAPGLPRAATCVYLFEPDGRSSRRG